MFVQNKTFDEIEVGQSAQITRVLTKKDIQIFAIMSGDINPAHLDEEYASSDIFKKIIAHGMWGGSLISTVLGTKLPGPGTIYKKQSLNFLRPVTIGDNITVKLTVMSKEEKNHSIKLFCVCMNQDNKEVITGEAEIIAPTEKVKRQKVELANIELVDDVAEKYYKELKDRLKGLKPLKTAVVHPVDLYSLQGVFEAAEENIIDPILIGPKKKIEAVASEFGVSKVPYEIIDTMHSHEAADVGVKLVRDGKVHLLMKGKLHSEEFLHPIVSGPNHLKKERRLSHVAILITNAYHKPLYISDIAINIIPNLTTKKDIVQNAIDLFKVIENKTPKVGIISAVETVTEKLPATLDATALCKMTDRGQITGGILDGPLGFDNAISIEAAVTKGITSSVAGDVDIAIMPNLEAANILYKYMSCLTNAQGAGVVVGARVPIILTSRADGFGFSRKASCAIASLFARTMFTNI